MPTKEKPNDVGRRKGRRIITNLGEELLKARRQHGLSQQTVARAASISRSQVSRIERGLAPELTVDAIARLLAIVGLELGARAYPGGPPVQDSAQLALQDRFRRRLPLHVRLNTEVPLPIPGDKRAWDGVIVEESQSSWVGAEFETQPCDIQALFREKALKLRDDPRVRSLLLVLADTRHNRLLVKEFDDVFRGEYPIPSKEIKACLAKGSLPKENGYILL